jgi:hypothetical protein
MWAADRRDAAKIQLVLQQKPFQFHPKWNVIFGPCFSRLSLNVIPAAGRSNAESLAWIIGGRRLH